MGRKPGFSQLDQQQGEVSCGGREGRRERGRRGGVRGGGVEAAWVTWAFVGRWWEAPPWPLALNAKQQRHCLTSAAADACAGCFSGNWGKKQTAPPVLIHASPPASLDPCAPQDSTNTHANIRHTPGALRECPDLGGLQRGQMIGDTQQGSAVIQTWKSNVLRSNRGS